MCFTITLVTEIKKSLERFKADSFEQKHIDPLFYVNGFSHQKHPVILDEDRSTIQMASWGLIPHWVKDRESAEKIKGRTLNARAETIYSKPSFRTSAKNKHCFVLVDGFFEWRQYKSKKYPYHIKLKSGEPFALAGLWDEWADSETGEILKTFTIITCDANPLLAKVHNTTKRMPVILLEKTEDKWLEEGLKREDGEKMLIPYSKKDLVAHPVSKLITSRGVNRNVPEAIKPFDYKDLTKIQVDNYINYSTMNF